MILRICNKCFKELFESLSIARMSVTEQTPNDIIWKKCEYYVKVDDVTTT